MGSRPRTLSPPSFRKTVTRSKKKWRCFEARSPRRFPSASPCPRPSDGRGLRVRVNGRVERERHRTRITWTSETNSPPLQCAHVRPIVRLFRRDDAVHQARRRGDSFWSAPVLWRFGARGAKAAEDCRSPRRFAPVVRWFHLAATSTIWISAGVRP
jgi:hypothetical protein